jgi:hypothetical protein
LVRVADALMGAGAGRNIQTFACHSAVGAHSFAAASRVAAALPHVGASSPSPQRRGR